MKSGLKYQNKCLRKGKILKACENTQGYLFVILQKDYKKQIKTIHRLVAETFNYQQINHIDGNKENNKVENLEWCNQKENMQHSYKIGLRKNVVKPINQYDKNGNFIKKWESIMQAERELKIYNTNISACCLGNKKTAGGYIWKFA